MSEARIWYSRHSDQETLPCEFQNEIVLSPEFFKEILDHPILTDMEAAKALSCSPVLRKTSRDEIGNTVDTAGRSFDAASLHETSSDRIGETCLPGMVGGH